MRSLIEILSIALVLALLNISCGKAVETPSGALGAAGGADTMDRTELAPASVFAAFAGNWQNANFFSAGPAELQIDAEGNVTHTHCQATWRLIELEPNGTPDAVKLEVLTTQGYRECPEPGVQTCELKRIMIGQLGNINAVRYSCPRFYNGALESAVGVFHE